ncbi:unnamed protein product [Clonostachys rosea f. rosea IK726]|uniref:Transcription factor domain-containing protein n=2 Tax=Bionectria ochroleuca TaxID=29856 RepID=A0A0B7K399_BIOOC|nr:unnamed protein product [Clonostachys rosea f. rosea IK726]
MTFCDNTHLHNWGVNLEAQIELRLVSNPTPRRGDNGNGSHDGLASKPASKQLQVGRAHRGKGTLKAPAEKQDRHKNLVLAAPHCLGCDLHWVTFAEPKEPYMSEACADFLTCVRDTFYPSQICARLDKVDRSLWVILLEDPLYFNAIQFGTLAYKELLAGLPSSKETYRHRLKTIRLLRERISSIDKQAATSDATALAIIILAHFAEAVGDAKSFEAHMNGLKALVDARGGLKDLKSGLLELRTKICRVDTAFAFLSDRRPMFFEGEVPWDRYVIDQYNPTNISSDYIHLQTMQSLDWRLVNVWLDMQQFSFMCNDIQKRGVRLDQLVYSKIMVSMQYRLLCLSFNDCSLNNALRAGMLVVMTRLMFGWHPRNDAQVRAAVRLDEAMVSILDGKIDVPYHVLFWMHMVRSQLGGLARIDVRLNAWLVDTIEVLSFRSWEESRKVLLSMVWFEFFGESQAELAFDYASMNLPGR